YYQRQKVEADRRRQEADEKAVALMREVLGEHPQYGYRRLARELRRRGVVINEKRIRRLLKEFHLALGRKVRKPKPNPLLEIVLLAGDRADLRAFLLRERTPEPFELLYTDFTLLPYRGGRVWFLPILDHATRVVLAWGVYPSPTAEAALEVWERAKAYIQERRGGLPRAIVHHDQGGAFLSHEWVGQLLLGDGQRVSYSLMGPRGNPVMESFFSRFKWENRDLFLEAKDLTELRGVIEERLQYYHEGRLHSGLGYKNIEGSHAGGKHSVQT
uniref:IS3 family transposase n=1 Tax=Thermus neutrinimicus TaxID=2908149 RepID=UPI001FAB31F4